jgi:hypothetical protein
MRRVCAAQARLAKRQHQRVGARRQMASVWQHAPTAYTPCAPAPNLQVCHDRPQLLVDRPEAPRLAGQRAAREDGLEVDPLALEGREGGEALLQQHQLGLPGGRLVLFFRGGGLTSGDRRLRVGFRVEVWI